MDRLFLKCVDAQNLQNPAEVFVESVNLIETGHHEVNADGDPDLGFHGVFGSAVERLDAQVLLDPFEEEFDVPTAFVDASDRERLQAEVIGDEDEALARVGVDEADAAELFRIVPFAFGRLQSDGLVAAQAGRLVDCPGLTDIEGHVAFGTCDKESARLMNAVKSSKIDVSTIHDIDASGIERDLVEDVHVVHAPVRNTDEYRDRAIEVDHCMQFDRRLGSPEMRPGEHREAKIDGRGVESVNHLVDVQPVSVSGVKTTRPANQNLRQFGVDAPVPVLVGVGQVGARDMASESHRVKMPTSAQARLDVAQTLPKSHLREDHREELVPRRKAPALPRHRVAVDATLKLFAIQGVDDLGENGAPGVHSLLRMNPSWDHHSIQMRDALGTVQPSI